MTLWHYTTGEKFLEILESGEIRPATAQVPDGARPIVWFSLNQFWEKTARKVLVESDGSIRNLNMEGTRERAGGLVRIGVSAETAPYDWRTLKELSGMKGRMAEGIEADALRLDARPEEWLGTFDAVPLEKWIAVEIYREAKWVSIPFERARTTASEGTK